MKKNTGKAPSIQWYFKDWNSDERLKLCSYAAKGFWSDIISQSCEMEIQGIFAYKDGQKTDNFIVISDEKFPKKFPNFYQISHEKFLQMFVGKTVEKRILFAELRKYNVLKESKDGTLYVQRIYRDMQLRSVRAEAGKKGGNPNLTGNLLDDLDKQNVKQNPTPSTSSSNSNSSSNILAISTKRNFPTKGLALEIQKAAITLAEYVEKNIGPFNPSEQKTFSGVYAHLVNYSKEHSTTEVFRHTEEWLRDKMDYAERRGKGRTDIIRLWISEVKKRTGYRGKGQ